MTKTITATEFKARCLELFDQLAARKLDSVTVTKRGRAVAVLIPPGEGDREMTPLHGFMKGSVTYPAGFDLTAPALDEPLLAAQGTLLGCNG